MGGDSYMKEDCKQIKDKDVSGIWGTPAPGNKLFVII